MKRLTTGTLFFDYFHTYLIHAVSPSSMTMLQGLYNFKIQVNSDLISYL